MILIRNWSSYQSYKDRKPPWIRFHKSLLDNYEFQSLSVESRAILPMLWLLASENEDPTSGNINIDVKKIAFRLRQDIPTIEQCIEELQAADFIECIESVTKSLRDSNESVSEFRKNVTTETETETEAEAEAEAETETEKHMSHSTPAKRIFDFWKKALNHPRSNLDKKRTDLINKWLKLGYTEDDLKSAVRGCSKTPHNMGDNDQGQKYDSLDLILRSGDHIDRFIRNDETPPRPSSRSDQRFMKNIQNAQAVMEEM